LYYFGVIYFHSGKDKKFLATFVKKYSDMRAYFGLLCVLFFAASCNYDKEKALNYIEKAQTLYDSAEYASAKQLLDSLKILYPNEFELQKQGLKLSRQIELKNQERNLAFCDSMLTVRQSQAEVMKSEFLFEKDPIYDERGKYVDRRQKLENNLQCSYIRCSVDELGEMSLVSVYYGSQAIHHSQLRVSKATGEYAETQVVPYDGGLNYSFVDFGMISEIVTYTQDKGESVIQFISNNKDVALKADYLGGKNYSISISQKNKNALAKTFDLSIVLSDIEKLKAEKRKAEKKSAYLQAKVN
jgi:hypothetical protein